MDRSSLTPGPTPENGSSRPQIEPLPVRRDPGAPADASTLAPGLRVLPRDIKQDVYRLYHVLRTLDDLVDEDQPQAEERVAAVERWATGTPSESPETLVLDEICAQHQFPVNAMIDFCRGMRHDIARSVIYTEDDLERYCQRVGGTVGIMLTSLLGATSPDTPARMATLGRAVQRTNILRDIDTDARQNRLYIAQETIDRFGPPEPGSREDLIRDQIARAEALYDQAANATSLLARGQRGMALCATLYRQILRQVERDNYNPGACPQPQELRILDRRPANSDSGRMTTPSWDRASLS